MRIYDLDNRPETKPYKKKTNMHLAFIKEPFAVETQEGRMIISPDTVDDWENGYYVAYPGDGSKPYSISPKFVRDNYVSI